MNVAEIIDAVKGLSPADRAAVAESLRRPSDLTESDSEAERQLVLYRQLMAEGLLKNIPPRRNKKREFVPIQIDGKPISETIIEDRR